MTNLILHLGSNQGNRLTHLKRAVFLLTHTIGALKKDSPIYQTAAWGETKQDDFLNQAILLHTILSPQEVLQTILDIEQQLGRKRLKRWGARVIDIDLIFYDDLMIEQANLIIPHPLIASRRFVLQPLADIIPDWTHPVYQKTVTQLLAECTDDLEVSLYDDLNF